MEINSDSIKKDLLSSIVVFFVALPLCLGIALASGAPPVAGLIAGIIGGIVVGSISGSATSVSGPAAGLTVIVLGSIQELGSYPAFLLAVFIAGAMQIAFGFLNAGVVGNYIPSSVIKGMLAAIGLIIIFKQLPHSVGYDFDYEGDEDFVQPDHHNTFSELLEMLNGITPGALIISLFCAFILLLPSISLFSKTAFFKYVPVSLIAVVGGTLLNIVFESNFQQFALKPEHLVQVPDLLSGFKFSTVDFSAAGKVVVYIVAFKIALVASIESLLSLEAGDKLDPQKRISPTSRELIAQGSGNILSSLIGGLPVTAVIVRTSANIISGAKSKFSTIFHGLFLLISVLAFPYYLNKIPLSALAVILIFVGYKMVSPKIIKQMIKEGKDQFIPFAATIAAILFSDLLTGVLIGLVVAIIFIVRNNFNRAVTIVQQNNRYLIRFPGNISFLNKGMLREKLAQIPAGSTVLIDGASSVYIDKDILETIEDFIEMAAAKDISVVIEKSRTSKNSYFKTNK